MTPSIPIQRTLRSDLTAEAANRQMAALGLKDLVLERYREPWRHYHNTIHVVSVIGHILRAEDQGVAIQDGASAMAFALFHDAIYLPEMPSGRNETLSAELCRAKITPILEPISIDRAEAAILATINHEGASGAGPDIKILLDADLAILGSEPADFDRYEDDIRREYNRFNEDDYRLGRAKVLKTFLSRERLYFTDWAYNQWEERARDNLERSLAHLTINRSATF